MEKKIYYRGTPYAYRGVDIAGKLLYLLYENGIVVHIVPQDGLDKTSIVDLALEKYYSTANAQQRTAVLQ